MWCHEAIDRDGGSMMGGAGASWTLSGTCSFIRVRGNYLKVNVQT